MKRKLLIFLGIITIFVAVFGGGTAYADRIKDPSGSGKYKASGTGADKCDASMLGFNAWWNGLGAFMNDSCEMQSTGSNRIGSEENAPVFVWTIVLNILHDLFMAIGYISIALITYGGYMYIVSSGDPGKATKARKTLTSAVIGLILVLTANIIVDTIVKAINISSPEDCGTSGLFLHVKMPNCFDDGSQASVVLAEVFSKALDAGAIMAVGFIVFGGISYITSNGSPDKTRKALRTLIFAAVGLVVVILAAVITNFVMGSVDEAVDNAMVITTWKG